MKCGSTVTRLRAKLGASAARSASSCIVSSQGSPHTSSLLCQTSTTTCKRSRGSDASGAVADAQPQHAFRHARLWTRAALMHLHRLLYGVLEVELRQELLLPRRGHQLRLEPLAVVMRDHAHGDLQVALPAQLAAISDRDVGRVVRVDDHHGGGTGRICVEGLVEVLAVTHGRAIGRCTCRWRCAWAAGRSGARVRRTHALADCTRAQALTGRHAVEHDDVTRPMIVEGRLRIGQRPAAPFARARAAVVLHAAGVVGARGVREKAPARKRCSCMPLRSLAGGRRLPERRLGSSAPLGARSGGGREGPARRRPRRGGVRAAPRQRPGPDRSALQR